jgi:hypothetical protein
MTVSSRVRAAIEVALSVFTAPPVTESRGVPRTRRVAMGDPQAPFEKVLAILDHHGLLDDRGMLRADVSLVSMGDHFDYGADPDAAAVDGERLLAWLAAHPPDQVVLILGNHDLARVSELAGFDDTRFQEARAAANRVPDRDKAREREFLARYPDAPTSESIRRDFSAFRVSQRERIWSLLRARRLRIAHADPGGALLVHAGVTEKDLSAIGLEPEHHENPSRVADALNRVLDEAVAATGPGGAKLGLGALHRSGDAAYGEGRGIFFHRPSNPEHERDVTLFQGDHRRRFDPRHLPRGLAQVIGHIGDKKCLELLKDWHEPRAHVHGRVRTMVVDGAGVKYQVGGTEPRPDAAVVWFTDGGMNDSGASEYELLSLAPLEAVSGGGKS